MALNYSFQELKTFQLSYKRLHKLLIDGDGDSSAFNLVEQRRSSYTLERTSKEKDHSFLGRFTGSKFLPISSSTYGSEVWGFQISRLMGSLNVVFGAKLEENSASFGHM
ncbi:hypothetical protein ROHU_007389 [Labeo rohita]|uniref:Uncharacterized protein n=1 Tax=Labeo rohita TaxID=84645 RepID=A0A498MGX9_LABRO|nr:hypothetical protein ROHU_032406 [Labeo rohita]RXN19093.1 hypothetical protein ROHU_007389 [Labeo rohita]